MMSNVHIWFSTINVLERRRKIFKLLFIIGILNGKEVCGVVPGYTHKQKDLWFRQLLRRVNKQPKNVFCYTVDLKIYVIKRKLFESMGTLTPKPNCFNKRRRFDMLQPNYDRRYLIPLSGTSSSNSSSSSGFPLLFLLANLSRANCSCRSRSRRNLRDNQKITFVGATVTHFREIRVESSSSQQYIGSLSNTTTTATKTLQMCIFDSEKQYFCTLCTCIFHLLTF